MSQYNGTHYLTRLVLHAILSESGPIRACHFTRDNPLVTYSGMPKPNTFFPMIRLERHAQTMWHAWVRLKWHAIWACPSQLERQVSWV